MHAAQDARPSRTIGAIGAKNGRDLSLRAIPTQSRRSSAKPRQQNVLRIETRLDGY